MGWRICTMFGKYDSVNRGLEVNKQIVSGRGRC